MRNSASGSPELPPTKSCAKGQRNTKAQRRLPTRPTHTPSHHWTSVLPVIAKVPIILVDMAFQVLDSQTLSSVPYSRYGNSAMRASRLVPGFPRHPQSHVLTFCHLLQHNPLLNLHTNPLPVMKASLQNPLPRPSRT